MVVAKCPLRVSLAGGGTDLEKFITTHGSGQVVSFPCNLYTSVSIHNNHRREYIINYSRPEKVKHWKNIKNNLAREVFRRYDNGPVTITFNSDIYSTGSGLASSSSFCIAILKAFNDFYDLNKSNFEICKTALEIERTFNPLTGRQDPYSCGMSGLKHIEFSECSESPKITHLDSKIFKDFKMWLMPTNLTRQSTKSLEATIESNLFPFFECASNLKDYIEKDLIDKAIKTINDGWRIKKRQTPHVLSNKSLKDLDLLLEDNPAIVSHRLCGAGGGGYFFCITSNQINLEDSIQIEIANEGVKSFKI
tara:strand:+ start:1132 stop:2052 length:921 start_codon:yes stop_codon:yes gene_type:complete